MADPLLYGTIADGAVLDALSRAGASVGDRFDKEIGGFTPSGGTPARVQGTLVYFGEGYGYERIAAVEFGDANLLIITPAYEQVIRPEAFRIGPIDPSDYDVFVVKHTALHGGSSPEYTSEGASTRPATPGRL